MNEFEQHQRVYKLEGASLLAAQKVFGLTQRYLKQNPVSINGRNMGDINKDYDDAYSLVKQQIERDHPELLKAIGLDQPSTRVVDTYGHFQRAYHVFPSIWISEIDHSIYLYSPLDYKGQHFVPKDGVRLSEKEADEAGKKVFMEGWGSPAPVLPQKEDACDMPADFTPLKHIVFKNDPLLRAHGAKHHRFFKLDKNGKSAQLLAEYKDRRSSRSHDFSKITQHISSIFNEIVASNNVLNADPNKTYNAGYMMSQDQQTGKPLIEIMIQNSEIDFSANKPVFAAQGDYFDTKKVNGRTVMVPHERTEEARKISKLFNAITSDPSLYDYEELLYPTAITPSDDIDAYIRGDGRAPVIREFGDDTYLEYRINRNDQLDFSPADSVEVSEAYYLWQRENFEDMNRGYQTPPMPADILAEHKKLALKTSRSGTSNTPKP